MSINDTKSVQDIHIYLLKQKLLLYFFLPNAIPRTVVSWRVGFSAAFCCARSSAGSISGAAAADVGARAIVVLASVLEDSNALSSKAASKSMSQPDCQVRVGELRSEWRMIVQTKGQ